MKTTISFYDININEKNPRTITDTKFGELVDSLLTFPKMLEKRPIAVDQTLTTYGGNMRYRALAAILGMSTEEIATRIKAKAKPKRLESCLSYWLKWQKNPEVPVVDISDLDEEEKKEFIIKDNLAYGQWDWDMLANEWDEEELSSWGMDLPGFDGMEEPEDLDKEDAASKDFTMKITFESEADLKAFRKEIEDAMTKYNARISVGGGAL